MDGSVSPNRDGRARRFLEAIERSGLVSALDPTASRKLLASLKLRCNELTQGEVLCTEGEVASSFWLLTRGHVTVSGMTSSGNVYVERRGPGDLVGELAAMRPGSRRSATVEALGHQTEVYCFSMRAVEALPCENQLALWRGLATHVATKLAATVPARTVAQQIADERAALLRRFVNEDALGRVRADGAADYECREVVILFSDLVGFSAMAAKAPPEEVADSIKAAMSAQADVIEAHQGFVDKLMGDGLMAYWLPESDALEERRRVANMAVDAANAIAQEVGNLLHPVTREPLEVRIGLHIGEVYYGNFGSDRRWAVTLIGQPVNLAARIESAKPEQGEATYGPLRVSEELSQLLEARHVEMLPDKSTVQVKTDQVTFIHRRLERGQRPIACVTGGAKPT